MNYLVGMQRLIMGHCYPMKHLSCIFLDDLQFLTETLTCSELYVKCRSLQFQGKAIFSFSISVTFLLLRVVLWSA